ncbi:succinate-CoA ligase [Penicillium brevicompactum]|uniref:Succinate--CoA ligase [ADP-forming] subunit beta, mitochondrial n=1 Tax=Penicillium brevicompactum TaxID=5074 RepID=A0A9W9Q3Z7_PENBR|nr:succinate-CoA ligase [Penicillium brevicompactum]
MLSICARSGLKRDCLFVLNKTPRTITRAFSIHEYQAQKLMKKAGIPVVNGELARTPEQVELISKSISTHCVLKSQILSGGRKKGRFDSGLQGGIQFATSPSDAREKSEKMLGHRLHTQQTNQNGLLVNKVYVAEHLAFDSEYYIAITIDRENYAPAVIVSKQGGVDIEDAAHNDSNAILRFPLEYDQGVTDEIAKEISQSLGLTEKPAESLTDMLKKLYNLFTSHDATLLEINPLVRTPNDEFVCLDSKFTFDNAAAPRQPNVSAMQDKEQDSTGEQNAQKHGLVYVRLEGNIGNVVNGAGLAMATNDAISFYGGKSANFLDAGGQATTETMVKAFEIILKDERVEVILVNIYGGIIRCDMVAESIIQAAAQLGPLRCPIVVRLQGTNSEKGQRMIRDSGLNLISEADFGRAAQIAVQKASNKW